ncbi:MAG: S1C family serine protease [Dehalococcoidia bacterium]
MDRSSNSFLATVTVIAVVVLLVINFLVPSTGIQGIGPSSSADSLYDEGLVQGIYERVSPAVVEVYADQTIDGSFIEVSSGSGFLVDKEGHIATNHHVIAKADRVRIVFLDDTNIEAEVLGRNPANDLAVLKVAKPAVSRIEPVEFGDSSLVRPGQMAIAIGSPFGLKGSVTVGVSSGINRGLRSDLGRFIPGMLQTDALINPGNSGGPLLNSSGQVVGINTAIELSSAELNQRSIGFAVPINTLEELLPRLKEQQVLYPPWLGIISQSLRPLMIERLQLTVTQGFYVVGVTPSSPAEAAGLIPAGIDAHGEPMAGGDIIVAVNGVPVASGTDLTMTLNLYQSGDRIVLTIIREGSTLELPLILGEWPEK